MAAGTPTPSTPVVTASPVPDGYASVAPWLITRDTKGTLAFMVEAFDGEVLAVIESPGGEVGHAEIRVGDSIVLLFDTPAGWPDTPSCLRLFVRNAAATFKRAVAAGAEPVTEVTELFFGDRVGRVRDRFGTTWWIQQHVGDLAPSELERRAGLPAFSDAMDYVQRTLLEHPPPVSRTTA